MAYTKTQVDNMIDRMLNPFKQDIADSNHTSGSPQAITANTPVRLTIDALARNVVTAPSYMTDRWDAVNNKMTAATEVDSPVYVGDISFRFTPAAAAEGTVKLTLYIDDTVPKLIRTYTSSYKGPADEPLNILATWYWGSETGYDAKNDGIYFEVEFTTNGSLYEKGAVIYMTQ